MKHKGRMSIFWKTFLSYAAIIAVMGFALGIYIHSAYEKFSAQSVYDTSQGTLESLRYQNENLISQMQNIVSCISSDSEMHSFRFEEAPDKALIAKRKLEQYFGVTNRLSNVYLKYNIDDYLYSPFTSVRESMLLEHMIYERTSPDELRAILSSKMDVSILPAQKIGGKLAYGTDAVTYVFPLNYTTYGNGGRMLFQLPCDTYEKMMDYEVAEQQNFYLLHGDTVIVSRENLAIPIDSLIVRLSYDDTYSRTSIDGQEYSVFQMQGNYLSLRYLLVLPIARQSQVLGQLFLPFLVFLLLLLSMMMAVTLWITKRGVAPIKQISTMFMPPDETKNELSIIQTGIKQLQENNDALSVQLSRDMPERRAAYVHKFLSGAFESEAARHQSAKNLQIDDGRRYYAVMIVAYSNREKSTMNYRSVERLLITEHNGAVSDTISSGNIVALLFFDEPEQELERRNKQIDEIHVVCPTLTFAISEPHESAAEAFTAYLEAAHAYESRFIKGNKELLRFRMATEERESDAQYPKQLIERLDGALQDRDQERMENSLMALSEYLKNIPMSLYMFRRVYHDIMTVLLSRYQSLDEASRSAEDLFTLSDCLSLEEMDVLLRETCQRLIDRGETGASQHSPVIERVCRLLQERYSDANLSISQMAEWAGMSDAKFSITFRSEMGVPPNTYLLQLRMSNARKLLRSTDEPIKDIAVRCGYYDASSFIRRFRNYTGMTPVQYRSSREE